MAQRIYTLFLPLLLLLILGGCASKRLTKKAIELDKAGLFTEASTLYLDALHHNKNNVDAKIGLSRSGQLVLNQKLEGFKKQYDNNNTKEALYAYQECLEYNKATSNYGVQLYFPPEYNQYYQEVEDKYLNDRYKEGMSFLDVEDFTNAAQVFTEITNINSNYKDSNNQLITAIYEPKYRSANSALNNNLPRTAYYGFTAIERAIGSYKESKSLKAKALELATITLSVSTFSINSRGGETFQSALKGKIEANIGDIKLPFYKIIQEKNYYDPSTGRATSSMIARANLSGDILTYSPTSSRNTKTEQRGYKSDQITVYDSITKKNVGKTIYKKVTYSTVELTNKISITVRFAAIENISKRVLVSNTFQEQSSASVSYNIYNGNLSELFPGSWESATKDSPNDKVYTTTNEVTEFRQMFNPNLIPTPIRDLELECATKIAQTIANKISNYNPEP